MDARVRSPASAMALVVGKAGIASLVYEGGHRNVRNRKPYHPQKTFIGNPSPTNNTTLSYLNHLWNYKVRLIIIPVIAFLLRLRKYKIRFFVPRINPGFTTSSKNLAVSLSNCEN